MPLFGTFSQNIRFAALLFALIIAVAPCDAIGDDSQSATSYRPHIEGPSDDAERAMAGFELPAGFQAELVAAEPHLAHPVAFWIDNQRRIYVAESFRIKAGVPDTRWHMNWLEDDLACRTPQDRVAMYRKFFPDDFDERFTTHHDRLRRLVDTDGDGRMDHATVFANGFNRPETGIGAGVLSRGEDVYYACIPDLWRLRDADGDGVADERTPMFSGFGVHVGFYGHDLHGLEIGPDGRLYFSMGDRGFHLETPQGTFSYPDTGAVLRCELNGSGLEVFHVGLRNPQELAFDQYGNLFTGDNNSDAGDQARWVYVVDGGDSGWRIGWQFITKPTPRGPWNAEKLWKPAFPGQAAYIVPPIANVIDGPSGLAYYPGTGLPERFQNRFLLCDFRGAAATSGIWSLGVRPQGASFEVDHLEHFAWKVLATDVDFGPDGGVYLSDWVDGWDKTGKGRICRLIDPATQASDVVQQVRDLLGRPAAEMNDDELVDLLGHADMRIRLKGQFALVERNSIQQLVDVAIDADEPSLLARIHAVWGLGQLGRVSATHVEPILPLLEDSDAEIRAQTAKVLGEAKCTVAVEPLTDLVADDWPRVRFFAAQALGRIGAPEAGGAILELFRDNNDADPYLRHAGATALARIGDKAALARAATDPDSSVRMGVLLAYRRLEDPAIARFLNDPEPRLVSEAARAIYDVPIPGALPQLAAITGRPALEEPALRRALNASARIGGAAHATTVAEVAGRADVPETIRLEALAILGDWAVPPKLDRVVGLYRPIAERSAAAAQQALELELGRVLTGPDAVREKAVEVAAALEIPEIGRTLDRLLRDPTQLADVRAQAMAGLASLDDPRLEEALEFALADEETKVRIAAYRVLVEVDPQRAAQVLAKALLSGNLREQQQALRLVATIRDEAATTILADWLERLDQGQVPAELELDVEQAVLSADRADLTEKLISVQRRRAGDHPLAEYDSTILGGDAQRGRELFFHRAALSCLRCHKVDGVGGQVGPDLSDVGARQHRRYLMAAIVDPNQDIAKGYDAVIIETVDGRIISGVVKQENDEQLQIITPQSKLVTIAQDMIEARGKGKSAMPEDLIKQLTKDDLRDLVEFLATLRQTPEPPVGR